MADLFEKVEKAKKEWESSVDVISEGVIVYEAHTMTILRANWTIARLLDTTPHKMVGENLHLLLCGCMQPLCPLRSLLTSTYTDFLEYQPHQVEGIWALNTYPVPSAQEQSSRNVLVIRDVTQERSLYKQMIQSGARASMVQTVANLAQKSGPTLLSLQENLGSASRLVDQLRNALIDYRVALQAQSGTQTELSELTWEKIEARHHVEFLLQDFEGLLAQSNSQIEQIITTVNNLSELGSETPNMQPNDLNMIVEDSINAVWNEARERANIERFFGRMNLVDCNPLRLQTGLVALLSTLIKTFTSPKEISLQTRLADDRVEILVIASKPDNVRNRKGTSSLGLDWFETQIRPNLDTFYAIIDEHHGDVEVVHQNPGQFSILISLPEKLPSPALPEPG